MTKEALTLALEALDSSSKLINGQGTKFGLEGAMDGYYSGCFDVDGNNKLLNEATTAIKEALAQPDYRAVKTYHEGKPVYVSQTEFPPECKTVAEQTAYAFGWWKALESVRIEQPAQEPVAWCSQCGHKCLQQRPWVGLTDEERNDIYNQCQGVKVGSAISLTEAKLKEKNT